MARRKIVGSVGALAVAALLLAAVPAHARGPRAAGRGAPAWALAWGALADLWQAALARVGLREEPAPRPSGDQGIGVDPNG